MRGNDVPNGRPEGTDIVNDSLEIPKPDQDPAMFQDHLEFDPVEMPEVTAE